MHKGSIRILGGLLLGALLLSFAVFIYSGVGPRSPWMHQAVLLKFNHRFFLEYRSQNAGRWPVKFADLDSAVADAREYGRPASFVDPDTGQSTPWLLFDPDRVASLPEHGHIISAAPRIGGYDVAHHPGSRLVLFESGVVTWIPESDFIAVTQAR